MKDRIKVLSIGVDKKDMPQVPAAQAAADFARRFFSETGGDEDIGGGVQKSEVGSSAAGRLMRWKFSRDMVYTFASLSVVKCRNFSERGFM
jgi:hypothetical protein